MPLRLSRHRRRDRPHSNWLERPPELYTFVETESGREFVKRNFPGSVYARSAMTVAVDELLRAMDTGEKPISDLRDSRADLELAVAWHLSSQRASPVNFRSPSLTTSSKIPGDGPERQPLTGLEALMLSEVRTFGANGSAGGAAP